jgi:AraC-like DNA-binding protein
MLGTRYEEYRGSANRLPFVLHVGIKRDATNFSNEKNWHEDLELQICTEGRGSVLLNGESYVMERGDVVVVNSNVIHHTGTDSSLIYTCIIIRSDFCRAIGIDCRELSFSPIIRDGSVTSFVEDVILAHSCHDDRFRTAKTFSAASRLLIALAENHSVAAKKSVLGGKAFENVKSAIKYVRENYADHLSLDGISRAVYSDKFALCRDFKRFTGQTLVEYTNRYRCQKAAELLSLGHTVGETASACGFESPSFFTKTFKKYMGALPSSYKS